MYTPLPTPQEMGAWDHASIHDFGMRIEMLMENASREALAVLRKEVSPLRGKNVLLLAGKGNNGGDAIALGRHLLDQGAQVLVLLAAPKNHYKGVCGYHLRLAQKVGVPVERLSQRPPSTWPDAAIIVDGLLGTGFSGELRDDYRLWVDAINARRNDCFVLSIDVPSGLNALSGLPRPDAVRAHATVTFEEAKVGLALPSAAPFVGRLHVRAISIPAKAKERHPASYGLLNNSVCACYPAPCSAMHKGDGGRVCIVAGSPGLGGAACLTALGALRGGAGLVTVAAPAGICMEVKHSVPDIMTLPLGEGTQWRPEMMDTVQSFLAQCDAMVVGPGWGRNPAMADCLERLLTMNRPKTLFDADALFALAQRPELMRHLGAGDVLTPHPGEMARLLQTDIPAVQASRLEIPGAFARKYGVTLLLKGAGTVIAAPQGPTLLSPFSTHCLAVGGSGDVLSGLLGNLLARGLSPLQATCLAVYWHGFTGVRLEREYPFRGNLASEIAHMLPQAFKECIQ